MSPYHVINGIFISDSDYLFVHSVRGIYRSVIPLTIINENNESPVTQVYLSQNYPNPFNPVTLINYQIPERGLVTIKVFDLLGNEVKTLVNEFKEMGSYNINFKAEDLSSGIYIYKISVNNYIASKKMILVK